MEKPIKGYPGYLINDQGKIWTNKKNRYMSLVLNPRYLYVNLCKNSKTKMFRVHRLVAQHFIPNPNKYPCVNHIDGNKLNNIVSNLEWCTHKQNSQHAIKNNLHVRGESVGTSKLTEKQVLEIRNIHKKFTQKQLAKKYNVTQTNIQCILNRKSWRHI